MVLKPVGLKRKGANLNSIEWVVEHESLELCGPSDKSAKVSDFFYQRELCLLFR